MKKIQSDSFFFAQNEPVYVAGEGITRQIVGYDENIMMVKVIFDKGAIGYQHQHIHAQTTYVVSGEFEVTIDGVTKKLQPSDGFYAEPNSMHGCTCLEAGVLIDVFTPVRKDFIESMDKSK